jgi:hypothetical protein
MKPGISRDLAYKVLVVDGGEVVEGVRPGRAVRIISAS